MKELIDEKDLRILEVLKDDSSLSTHKISKKILIPITTVNNRIKKLRKQGIIKKYTVDIDKNKLGFNLSAYIMVNLSLTELKEQKNKIEDLIRIIRKNQLIESVEHVTGDIDLVLKVNVKSVEELNDYVVNILSSYRGIENTNTLFVLKRKQ